VLSVGDLVMRDYLGAVVHGSPTADEIARLLESARYAATLAKLAIDCGVVDPAPPEPSTTDVGVVGAEAVGYVLDGLLSAAAPVVTSEDVAYRRALREWALAGVAGYLAAAESGSTPEAAPEAPARPEPSEPKPAPEPSYARRQPWPSSDGSEIFDAEVVDDDGDDEEGLSPEDERELAELRELIYPPQRTFGGRG
jgi:hypothetical protein